METNKNSQGQVINLAAIDLASIANMSRESAAAIIAGISPEIMGRISFVGDRSSQPTQVS